MVGGTLYVLCNNSTVVWISPDNGSLLSGSVILDQQYKCEVWLSSEAWGLVCILWREPE